LHFYAYTLHSIIVEQPQATRSGGMRDPSCSDDIVSFPEADTHLIGKVTDGSKSQALIHFFDHEKGP